MLDKYICRITHFFMAFMIICYDIESKTEMVVGWLEVELMRGLRFFMVRAV